MLLCGQISMWSSTAPAAALTDSIYTRRRPRRASVLSAVAESAASETCICDVIIAAAAAAAHSGMLASCQRQSGAGNGLGIPGVGTGIPYPACWRHGLEERRRQISKLQLELLLWRPGQQLRLQFGNFTQNRHIWPLTEHFR